MDGRLLTGQALATTDRIADAEDAIAIVGAACRLPGAPDLAAFESLLAAGRDAVTEIPDDRWCKPEFLHPEPGHRGKSYTFAAGVLDDVYGFDPAFFGISPREAAQIDPQQRLLLELAHEAMEDAGIPGPSLHETGTGVFVGGSSWDYTTLYSGDVSVLDAYSMTGATLCSLANRISYVFNLRGPSLTVDTACSSSLVALHMACEAIRTGRVPMALVGGVNMLLAPQPFVGFSRASMLSRRGRCQAFDAGADGYVRAEGGGIVVLKPLRDALRDHDRIRAVVRGTGTNSDGRTTGLSLPSKDAQAALLREVYGRFGIDPNELDYVEAHGTGTPAGDPIEAGALGAVLGAARTEPLCIGSVKTNIGHLEAGSGMAGLLKAILVLQTRTIPASLHCAAPNPAIPFAELNLELVPEARPLRSNGHMPCVGINSFGFGGTNAHAVLGTAPLPLAEAPDVGGALPPLLISARSVPALRAVAQAWHGRVTAAGADVPALVRAAARRREHHDTRLAVIGATPDAMGRALAGFLDGADGVPAATGTVTGRDVAFVYSGNGSQWAGMGREALKSNPAFRAGMEQADAVLRPLLGWSVVERLNGEGVALGDTAVAQPLLFAVQVGATEALRAAGVRPAACLGHSVGEVAAAWAAGALTLGQAALVIHARSNRQQETHGTGAMAVLGLPRDQAVEAAAAFGLELAADNASSGVTVAGSEAGIAALGEEAGRRGWTFSRLDLAYAFHSALMEPIRAPLLDDLRGLRPSPTATPFISTVTGGPLEGTALDGAYWWDNVRRPVRFGQAARHLAAAGTRIFLEVGPQPVLQSYLHDALRANATPGAALPTLSRRRQAADAFALAAARCYAAGYDLAADAAYDGPAATDLPGTVFMREQFRNVRTEEATDRIRAPVDHPLLGWRTGVAAEEWLSHLDTASMPALMDHQVGGAPVMPAAGMVAMLLAAARARMPGVGALELTGLEIGRALPFEAGQVRAVRTRVGEDGHASIASRPRLAEDAWAVHATAQVGRAATDAVLGAWTTGDAEGEVLPASALYAMASALGLEYGPAFRTVSGVTVLSDTEAVVALQPVGSAEGLLDPTVLDGALQGLLALAARRLGAAGRQGMMPWRFGRVRLLRESAPASARLRIRETGPRAVSADVLLLDAEGRAVAELLECWFVAVSLGATADPAARCLRVATVDVASLQAGAPGAGLLDAALAAVAVEASQDDQIVAAMADTYVAVRSAAALRSVPEGGDTALRQALAGWMAADGEAEEAGMPAEDLVRSLLFDVPEAGADAALLAAAGDALPAVLRGEVPRPVPPAALLDQFLNNAPAGRRSLRALGNAAAAVARGWAPGQALRVLEVGAGRGTGTRALVQRLGAVHPGLRYVARTSEALLPALVDALAGFDGVTVEGPGGAGGAYDLVLSLHGLTLGGMSAGALAELQGELVPGGLLLAVEPLPNRVWDLVGIPAEGGLAVPLDAPVWTETLAVAGFAATAAELAPSTWPAVLLAGRSLRSQPDAEPLMGRVLVLAEAGDTLGEALAAALREGGTAVAPFEAGVLVRAAGVVMLLPELNAAGAAGVLGQVAALVEPLATAGVPLTLVVRGGETDAFAAALGGVRRVLANEAAGLRARLVRVAPGMVDVARLVAEIVQPDAEDEVLLEPGRRRAMRLRPGLPAPVAAGDAQGVLAVGRPGLLGTLGWREAPVRGALADDDVAIAVRAAGLNFRDVMWAMGLLPDEALLRGFAGPTLGLECAGVVVALGAGVTDLVVGDAVMAFAPASLGTQAVTKRHAVVPLPAGLGFAQGATVPVAFFTVVYALGELARLEAGERVLIHGGAGGVGLAAIQYARYRGAVVFATAGSDAKRALLRQLGVDHVLDSRDLAFADRIMAITGGEGVDVVLNSLSGEAMERSLGLLAPFGRFVELGKRDFYRNTPVGIRPLRHNASYFAVDADQLPLSRPKLSARILGEIGALLAEGSLRPLPYRSFAFENAVDAFRLMQAAGHIGKIVLEPGAVAPRLARAAPAFVADAGTYVVTGGLSGFGLETARWLVRHGARHLALVGRRGAGTPGAEDVLAGFAAEGVQARALACDMADAGAVADMLELVRGSMPPLSGVAHAAMVMDDAFLPALDVARFAAVLGPKWGGAEALDRLTRHDDLSLFLLFSSITTVLGNPGQASYVAANAALEAIAERRHAEGLPALAVGWGPIGDAGYLARAPEVSEALARRLGTAHLKAQEALDVLPAMLASGCAVVHMADLGGARRSQLPLLASPLYEFLATGGAVAEEGGGGDLRAMIADRTPDDARRVVAEALAAEVAAILQLPPSGVGVSRPLAEFGMDSLMAVELRTAVEARFGVNLPLFSLSEGMTLTALASKLVDPLLGGGAEPVVAPTAVDAMLSRYEASDIDPAPPSALDSFAGRARIEAYDRL